MSTAEDVAVEVDVLANDVDHDAGDSLTVRVVRQPQRGSATVQADGKVLYTPDENTFGEDMFRYRVTDSSRLYDEATITVYVRSVNDPPVFSLVSSEFPVYVNAPPGSAVGAPVTATDAEEELLRYRLSGTDSWQFDIDEISAQISVADGADLGGWCQMGVWCAGVGGGGAGVGVGGGGAGAVSGRVLWCGGVCWGLSGRCWAGVGRSGAQPRAHRCGVERSPSTPRRAMLAAAASRLKSASTLARPRTRAWRPPCFRRTRCASLRSTLGRTAR